MMDFNETEFAEAFLAQNKGNTYIIVLFIFYRFNPVTRIV